jgi:hypothetical protein
MNIKEIITTTTELKTMKTETTSVAEITTERPIGAGNILNV